MKRCSFAGSTVLDTMAGRLLGLLCLAVVMLAAASSPSRATWDYKFPMTDPVDWVAQKGHGSNISVAATGRVGIIGNEHLSIWIWDGARGHMDWHKLPALAERALNLALPPFGAQVVFTTDTGNLYRLNRSGGNMVWELWIPGGHVDVAYSPLGDLYTTPFTRTTSRSRRPLRRRRGRSRSSRAATSG